MRKEEKKKERSIYKENKFLNDPNFPVRKTDKNNPPKKLAQNIKRILKHMK